MKQLAINQKEQYQDMELAPDDDGIYNMNILLGTYSLICSYQQLKDFHYVSSMEKATHWVSHIEISPDSKRILFLHRWSERLEDETCFLHRLISMNPDGSEMCLLECSDHPLPQLKKVLMLKASVLLIMKNQNIKYRILLGKTIHK